MSIKKSLAKLTGMLLVLSSFNSGLTAKAMIESFEETKGQFSFGSQSNLIMNNSPSMCFDGNDLFKMYGLKQQPGVLDKTRGLIQAGAMICPLGLIAASVGIGGALGSGITALVCSLGDDSAPVEGAAEDAADTQE